MPFYLVTKTYQYTETVYVEAGSSREAQDASGMIDGSVNQDDTWVDSSAYEISEEKYLGTKE